MHPPLRDSEAVFHFGGLEAAIRCFPSAGEKRVFNPLLGEELERQMVRNEHPFQGWPDPGAAYFDQSFFL